MPPEAALLEHTAETAYKPLKQPLLTIAVPTFNRAAELTQLLDVLLPQLAAHPGVELFISDNASTDSTPEAIASAALAFRNAGARLRTHRHAENIGSDANFAFCFQQAQGHFFWMCGDDDLIVPDAVSDMLALLETGTGQPAALDLVYATSYGFREDFRRERTGDPLGRQTHILADPHTFATVVNIMFTFISGMVVNRDRLQQVARETPEAFVGTNLVQLSWCLPLLLQHRRSAVLWTRPVAARVGNAHGYSLGKVFGPQLSRVTERLLPGRPDLSGPILNLALRRWMPSVLIEFRSKTHDHLNLENAGHDLRATYGSNPRFWLFTWPALHLPLPLARIYTRGSAALSKLLYMAEVPGFWKKKIPAQP